MFYFLTGLLVAVGIFGYVMAIRASLYCESRVWKNLSIKRNWLAPAILGGLLSPGVVFVGIVLGGNIGGGIFRAVCRAQRSFAGGLYPSWHCNRFYCRRVHAATCGHEWWRYFFYVLLVGGSKIQRKNIRSQAYIKFRWKLQMQSLTDRHSTHLPATKGLERRTSASVRMNCTAQRLTGRTGTVERER